MLSASVSFQQACSLLWLQLMLVWREYAEVNAYKCTEMSHQVTEAQQQLNQGICHRVCPLWLSQFHL